MDTVYRCCAGLDVHKQSVQVCVRVLDDKGQSHQWFKKFGTMTSDLLELSGWLSQFGVTHVAMESTGVLWKPIFNILECGFTVWVCNAQHMKQVPGRKTDMKDCVWIAQLLQHGLLKPSFVPERALRDLRDLTREHAQLMGEVTRVKNRIHKILQDANIKASSVMSDVMGVSGRAILKAIVEGNDDPAALAELARGRLRRKMEELVAALTGKIQDHHRFMLKEHLRHLAAVEIVTGEIDARIEQVVACEALNRPRTDAAPVVLNPARTDATPVASSQEGAAPTRPWVPPLRDCLDIADSIPGINMRIGSGILAETGTDMSQFPTAAHLASWAGMSPGNNESAGKRKSGKTEHGDRWLCRLLTQAAWAVTREKEPSYLKSLYNRIARRRGKKRAIVAVGHAILCILHHLLSTGAYYHDLGPQYFDKLNSERTKHYLVKRLETLGFSVQLQPAA